MSTQATLADVATLAGVSLATASRALSPTKGAAVGPELRARVRAAAAELSYAPNAHAQAMRSPTASSAGLIVHDIADPVAAAIASGVLAAAADQGLIVTIGASGGDAEAEVRLVETLRRQRARGIILAGSRFTDSPAQRWLDDEVSAMRAGGGRVVTIGQPAPGSHAVVVDNHRRRRRSRPGAVGAGVPAVRRAGRTGVPGDLGGPGHRLPRRADRSRRRAARRRTCWPARSAGTAATPRCGICSTTGSRSTASSPSTTRWRWARWRRCATPGCGCPATSRWPASATSPRSATWCRG